MVVYRSVLVHVNLQLGSDRFKRMRTENKYISVLQILNSVIIFTWEQKIIFKNKEHQLTLATTISTINTSYNCYYIIIVRAIEFGTNFFIFDLIIEDNVYFL